MTRDTMIEKILQGVSLDNANAVDDVLDYLIMVMGDNTQDMVAWLKTSRAEFNNESAIDLLEKNNLQPVQKALRKIMEQDSRIG